MNPAATQPALDIAALLAHTGARPRGNRHDCPKCGGCRTVTHSDEAFFCHKCGWKGNAVSLAKELGLYRRLSRVEYRDLRQNRDRADHAARVLYERVKVRRFELLEELRGLGRLEAKADVAGMDHLATWDALALVYGRRPALLAELAILENCGAADLIRWFSIRPDARERVLDGLFGRGGFTDAHGKFVEVAGA